MFLIDDNTMKRLENNKVAKVYKNSSFTLCAAKYPLNIIMESAPEGTKRANDPKLENESSNGLNNKKGVKRKADEIEEDNWSAKIPSKRAKTKEKSSNDDEDFNPNNEQVDPMDNLIVPDNEESSSDENDWGNSDD